MTSWDHLEAYLARLVRSLGGTAYVLRDSGGRHLAPRPPEFAEDELLALGALRRHRNLLREGECSTATRIVLAARAKRAEKVRGRIREFERVMQLMERFKQHADVLENAVGADFAMKGPGKRYVHRAADLPFIAERLLSSYLLIVAFPAVDALDGGGILMALERARSTICDMLSDLPPDGGGDQAVSNANRPA